ncbi:MAG: alpha-L-rhamnosidase, partial [Clostridia bacterium]|nr:alpha-L-rhamnosidase [Clostridia bacterium]
MKLNEKFGIYGIDDERQRKVVFPTRVVLTKGNVKGESHLTAYKPAQVAIYGYHDQCVLDNREGGENAAVLVDFGRELHGTVTVSVWSMNGAYANFILRLGESVSEALTPIGEKNATNDHANRDMKTGSGPWASNESNESGFRFAYVELTSPGMFMEIRCITATLVYRDIEYRGSFACSDPLIGKIYDTAAYTVHLNMQRYLWDGIKRDRLVWAGDMNTELATILAVFGENEVVPKSLDLVRDVTPTDASMNGLSSYNLW